MRLGRFQKRRRGNVTTNTALAIVVAAAGAGAFGEIGASNEALIHDKVSSESEVQSASNAAAHGEGKPAAGSASIGFGAVSGFASNADEGSGDGSDASSDAGDGFSWRDILASSVPFGHVIFGNPKLALAVAAGVGVAVLVAVTAPVSVPLLMLAAIGGAATLAAFSGLEFADCKMRGNCAGWDGVKEGWANVTFPVRKPKEAWNGFRETLLDPAGATVTNCTFGSGSCGESAGELWSGVKGVAYGMGQLVLDGPRCVGGDSRACIEAGSALTTALFGTAGAVALKKAVGERRAKKAEGDVGGAEATLAASTSLQTMRSMVKKNDSWVILGHGSKQQFGDTNLMSQATGHFVDTHVSRPQKMLALYGGDPFSPDAPDVSHVVRDIGDRKGAQTMGVQADVVVKEWDSPLDAHLDHSVYVNTQKGADGKVLWGGTDADGRPVGNTRYYLDEVGGDLNGVAVFGGGDITRAELRFARQKLDPSTQKIVYAPSKMKNGDGYGPVHDELSPYLPKDWKEGQSYDVSAYLRAERGPAAKEVNVSAKPLSSVGLSSVGRPVGTATTTMGQKTHRVWDVPTDSLSPTVVKHLGLSPDQKSVTLYVRKGQERQVTEPGIVNRAYTAKKQGLLGHRDNH